MSTIEVRLHAAEAVANDPICRRLGSKQRANSRRVWAAILISRHVDTCESILLGRHVMAGLLDGEVLRRALRGGPLPDPSAFIEVTPAMLDAVAEAGSISITKGARR